MSILAEIKNKVFGRDNFSCQKCRFRDESCKELEIHHINPKILNGSDSIENLSTLCSICHKHAPDNEKEFMQYISEKIDAKLLETFRKSNYSVSKKTRVGMNNVFKEGRHITKAPRGYKLVNKQLVIDEQEAKQVRQLFEEFLNTEISLTQLAKKYNFTTAGVKKLLQNKTYLGFVKFAAQESKGSHQPIIAQELFNKTQEKLKR